MISIASLLGLPKTIPAPPPTWCRGFAIASIDWNWTRLHIWAALALSKARASSSRVDPRIIDKRADDPERVDATSAAPKEGRSESVMLRGFRRDAERSEPW